MTDIIKSSHDYHAEGLTYWIAHGEEVLHYGTLNDGENISTGLDFLETFKKRRPWMARVIELGGNFT